jgi:hypothetical protein
MPNIGPSIFDRKGQTHKTADDATASDIASVLGRVGDGDSLAPGIARVILEKRAELEAIFVEHDMVAAQIANGAAL